MLAKKNVVRELLNLLDLWSNSKVSKEDRDISGEVNNLFVFLSIQKILQNHLSLQIIKLKQVKRCQEKILEHIK